MSDVTHWILKPAASEASMTFLVKLQNGSRLNDVPVKRYATVCFQETVKPLSMKTNACDAASL